MKYKDYYTVSVMQDDWRFIGSSKSIEGLLLLIDSIPSVPIKIRFGVSNNDKLSSVIFDGTMEKRK